MEQPKSIDQLMFGKGEKTVANTLKVNNEPSTSGVSSDGKTTALGVSDDGAVVATSESGAVRVYIDRSSQRVPTAQIVEQLRAQGIEVSEAEVEEQVKQAMGQVVSLDIDAAPRRSIGRRMMGLGLSAAAMIASAGSSLFGSRDVIHSEAEAKAPTQRRPRKYLVQKQLFDRELRGFSGAKLARKAANGTVGLAKIR